MTRALLHAALPLLLAGGLAAQAPAPKPADVEKALIGKWEGPYQSDQAPPGGLRLTIAKEAGAWKPVMGVVSDQDIPAGDIREFKVVGTRLTWEQDIAGYLCRINAELVSGTIKGESQCEQGGAVVITATWVLLKA